MRARCLFLVMAGLAVLVPAAAVGAATQVRSGGSATTRWRPGPPFVRGAQTVPVYSYQAAVRESVLVKTSMDSDGDGQPDQVAVDVIRPREAAAAGIRVPVIMEASPYYEKIGRGTEQEIKKYDPAGTAADFPLFYDNFFVPRGYAVVLVDLPGTNRSTGCVDFGGPAEVGGVVAVIDWLNGRGSAGYRDGRPAVADWSTGKVGMIGKSWDGSVANGVAATGVAGLKTIVPISAVSSWYDYIVGDGGLAPDEDPTYLDADVSGRPKGVCGRARAAQRTAAGTSGDYNPFWAQRDFRASASKVRASVFAVHGLGDRNVTPSQVASWWAALGEAKVPRKLWLSREGHVDPFDFRRAAWVDTLHRWFDYWLQGLPNRIMAEPAVSVERGPGQWVDEKSWPASIGRPDALPLGGGDGSIGSIGTRGAGTRTFTDSPQLTEAAAIADPTRSRPGRLVFLSAALTAETRISGTPSVTLRVRVSHDTTEVTARLMDYGSGGRVNPGTPGQGVHKLDGRSCWGDSIPTDGACYPDFAEDVAAADLAIVTRGWLDAAHHTSLRERTPLAPDQWYSMIVPLQATDVVIAAGHRLGLVVTGTDQEVQEPVQTGAQIDVDLGDSHLDLPMAGPRL
jgi:X-Pro dipeptidyl-peptidase